MEAENSSKIVPFKVNTGLSSDIFQELVELSRHYGWDSIHSLPVEQIVVEDWVQLKCRYGCQNFNSNWCCPPATPGPDTVRSVLKSYSVSTLLVGCQKSSYFYRTKSRRRAHQVRYWKETVALERFLFLQGYYKAFSLLSGACALCRKCGYPHQCHFPRERRPSLESFSIDVIATVQSLGLTTPVAKEVSDIYYHYAIILVE